MAKDEYGEHYELCECHYVKAGEIVRDAVMEIAQRSNLLDEDFRPNILNVFYKKIAVALAKAEARGAEYGPHIH